MRVVAFGKEPERVRSPQPRLDSPPTLRRKLERLDGLPLRPSSVRWILHALPEDGETALDHEETLKSPLVTEIDPGWVLRPGSIATLSAALGLIAEQPWWSEPGGAASAAVTRQWRHAVAVSQVARRLARESGDPDPDQVARAALLHGLGRWAVAAVDPDWLALWMTEADPNRRLDLERAALQVELTSLGRTLAERWGCDPLVVDAAWLHADRQKTLNGAASEPKRLALIQEAYEWAEQTPWALESTSQRDGPAGDPRLRLLIAEVQVRCGAPLVEPDATAHEERLARAHARLRRQWSALRAEHQSYAQVLSALAGSEPTESPETWAERAGLCWCREPGVTAARVVWTGPGSVSPAKPGAPQSSSFSPSASPSPSASASTEQGEAAVHDERPARVVVLGERGRSCAEVHLWTTPGLAPSVQGMGREFPVGAWQAWAALVAERTRLAGRLERVVRAHRDRVASEETRLRQAKFDALAEFAAGAGHELNNPLAVIVGRAQLLLARESDPGAVRSLRAILTQAQRAHRILRDLMFVARPPQPRPRSCQPEEIIRNCLRDFREAAEERGVRLVAEGGTSGSSSSSEPRIWADPDALRHVAEVLLRNALEATPKGGTIQVSTATRTSSAGVPESLSWLVQDSGRGLSMTEAAHLFDPFYCGRQAGRGLGLGLPRAARIVAQAGGEIRWHTAAGQGTTFHVHMPLSGPPQAPTELAAEAATPA